MKHLINGVLFLMAVAATMLALVLVGLTLAWLMSHAGIFAWGALTALALIGFGAWVSYGLEQDGRYR